MVMDARYFNEKSDKKLDEAVSDLDLVSIRMETKTYSGMRSKAHYWVVAQSQPDGSYDMHFVSKKWVYNKSTYYWNNAYKGQHPKVPDDLKGVDQDTALRVIEDFNALAEQKERETRYSSDGVILRYPLGQKIKRAARFAFSGGAQPYHRSKSHGILSLGEFDYEPKVESPQMIEAAPKVLALPAPEGAS